MIRQEIRERILYLLNEDISSPTFYTTAQANNAIQEAMEIIAEEVRVLRRQAIISTRPGRHWYTTYEIGDACMTPYRIWSDATEERLMPITMRQLECHYSQFLTVASDTPQWWYPISHDAFGIWPGAGSGGTILRVDYMAWPETLVQDDDEPVMNEIDQDLIILYGEYDGLIRQWEFERAIDVFSQFVQAYLDTRYKTETRRFHYMLMKRTMGNDSRVISN
jgi:hypothetical protein